MRLGAVSAVPAGAALAGFLLGAALFASRPAGAQFSGQPRMGQPLLPQQGSAQQPPAPAPQPIEIQALDPTHFVVATREPRLVQQVGNPGTAVSMVLPVVTHYTVSGNRLVPLEHVRVPTGWQPVQLAGD